MISYWVPVIAKVMRYHPDAKTEVEGILKVCLLRAKDKDDAKEIAKESLLEQKADIRHIGDPLTWNEHMLKVKEDKLKEYKEKQNNSDISTR